MVVSQQSQRISSADMNNFVNDTIKYVLIHQHQRYPVKRADLVKNAMNAPGRQYAQVIKQVQEKFEHVFGLKFVELGNSQRYILLNKFQSKDLADVVEVSDKVRTSNRLLMIILAHILMRGGIVKEPDMWAILKKLKVVSDDPKNLNLVFGDVRKMVAVEFVRQMYLELRRIPQTDPPQLEFSWGARAKREVNKEAVLNFVCQMHKKMDPKRWTAQWKIVQDEKNTDVEMAA